MPINRALRFRDYTKCAPVSLIYTKSREYTAMNKGETTRRMLDVAGNIRVTFTGTLVYISLARPEFRF